MALGRDSGKITRFVDRLESSRLVTREIGRRDRRFSILKPTAKGKQLARDLASVFDSIREELFAGISESDVLQLGKLLPQLYKNAVCIGSRQKCEAVRERKRIGIRGMKTEGPKTRQPHIAADSLTASPEGRAANTVPIEHEGHEGELIRHEQSGQETVAPGMLVSEQDALVLK
jgi:hypothetical protein